MKQVNEVLAQLLQTALNEEQELRFIGVGKQVESFLLQMLFINRHVDTQTVVHDNGDLWANYQVLSTYYQNALGLSHQLIEQGVNPCQYLIAKRFAIVTEREAERLERRYRHTWRALSYPQLFRVP